MKKIVKIFGILSAIAAMPFLYSCDDDVDYEPAEVPDGAQVYFSSEASSSIELSSTETSFAVTVLRANTDEAVSVPISVVDESGLLSVPSSVSFTAGASQAALTIGYDPEDFDYDVYYTVTITIPDDYTTPYGLSNYSFSVVKPAPWTSLGYASYTEDFMTTFYSVGNLTYDVEIQENDFTPGLFRLVNPYGASYYWNEEGDWDASQDWYLEINASDPDGVFITEQDTGMNWGYGNVMLWSMADYYVSQGAATLEEMKEAGYCGTYADGIITFPTSMLLICMPEYSEYYYYANLNGAFMVAMPGVVVGDYSIEVAYTGQLTTAGDTHYAIGEVTFAGADVEYARVALVEGSDYETAAQSIIDGTVDYIEISESSTVQFSCEETGEYMIVAVSYGNDVAQEYDYVSFDYTIGASPWTSLGMATYTDDIVGPFFGADPVTYQVEIQENSNTPGLFRLVNPYGEDYPYNDPGDWDETMNYYMEINACDPEGVYIEYQDMGFDWGYGTFYVYSYAAYMMDYGYTLDDVKEAGYCGTYADGIITFPASALLVTMADYSSNLYYGNTNGAFQVVMPGYETETTAVATNSVASQSCSKTFNASAKAVENSKTFRKPAAIMRAF